MPSSLRKCLLAFGAAAVVAGATLAAPPAGSGLDLLDVDVMFVGAHPDDDLGVLATFSRYLLDEGFGGSVVTLTRGEGGGNAIGNESGIALGLIRQEEERRALAIAGVTAPQFLGYPDFHFTLSADEALARWGDGFICDVVRRVRMQRPEVIVTMWPGPGTHGQHQMAARAATLAFDRAGDPSFCPEQIQNEHVAPFTPRKLYYYPPDGAAPNGTLSIPSDGFSRHAGMRYADLRGLATAAHRSQGYDRGARVPVTEARPDRFLLVRSRVPVLAVETSLLEGAVAPAGASPPGVWLEVESPFEAAIGTEVAVSVRFTNGTASPMQHGTLALSAPEGWAVRTDGSAQFDAVASGGRFNARFLVRPSPSTAFDELATITAGYEAEWNGRMARGRNVARLKPIAPLQVSIAPLYDVASYRAFAAETHTEWVISKLPTRLPLVVGPRNSVAVVVKNSSGQPARGELQLSGPAGLRIQGPASFAVGPNASAETKLVLDVDASAVPEGRHSARLPIVVKAVAGGVASQDSADAYLLPSLTIPRVAQSPKIDGDLSDMQSYARGAIAPKDLWWRREPSGPQDLSAEFFLGYDARFLYVGLHVRDDTVVCNIAPDDIKAQLRSDAIGITVDPSGRSRDTSTTFQAAAFPCTTAGFGARGFRDADARQGLMEETAPGMQVASRKTADGYDIEAALPWAAMPQQPKPGDEIGLNVVLYDGDDKDARSGANISKSGLAWAAFEWGGKQALPYLWPRVLLGR